MNRQKLTDLIHNPQRISQKESAMLKDMAAQYPYATVIQIMLAKSRQQQPDSRQQLATAALYTPNRAILRQVMEDTLTPFNSTGSLPAPTDNTETVIVVPAYAPEATIEVTQLPTEKLPLAPKEAGEAADQPPQEKEDIFDELQKNLKKLRKERAKHHLHEAKERPELDEGTAATNDSASTTEPAANDLMHGMHPTLQQLVEDHQQQTLDNPRIQEQRSLIDSFLENAPNMQRRQLSGDITPDNIADLTQNISFTPQDLATETLAKIMERQGKTEKAIDIYQKLVLKYPQKSAYFADCIERLKKDSR